MGRMLISTALFLSVVAVCILAHSHSHEAPHLKYGREVNEAAQRGEDTIGDEEHGHSHSHHGHSHGHEDEDEDDHYHGHTHGGASHHGHTHGASNHHGHSHGESHHGHSHEDLNKDFKHKSHGGSKKQAGKDFQLYDKNGYFAFLNDPKTRLWTYALGSTFLISTIPCFFLTFIPIDADTENSSLLKFLLAFGAGGLLGDAFLHLIPHAQMHVGGGEHSHSHSHSHGSGEEHGPHDNSVGLWVLGGLLFFFVSEKLLRILTGGSGHGHSHEDESKKPKKQTKKPKKAKQSDNEASSHETDHESEEHGHHDQKEDEAKSKRVVSWLNMGADFLHNTTDGLAIGASFIAGTTVGVFTTLMVFFHEIPHEIGDFAFLIRSGHSKRRAQLIQLLTALGAFGGCIVALQSVNAQELNESAQSSWVQPFTAGGFIYIAAVSILPELLEKSSFWLTVAEVFAMCVGVLFMHIITLYE